MEVASPSPCLFVVNTWRTRVISPFRRPSQVSFSASQRKKKTTACYALTIWWLTDWLGCVAVTDLWFSCCGAICHCRCMWLEPRAHKHPWAIKVLYSFTFVPVFSKSWQKTTVGWVQLRSPLAVGLRLMFDWPRCVFRWGPLALGYCTKSHNCLYIFLFKNPPKKDKWCLTSEVLTLWHASVGLLNSCSRPLLLLEFLQGHGKI